jgi:glutamine amidotransferase
MKKIVVLDYGMGNVRSVANALRRIGAEPEVSRDPDTLERADALVIPGVGAFPRAMENLAGADLLARIHEFVASGRPVLGICIGMQILFDHGLEYGDTPGLGLIGGAVEKIPVAPEEGRLPHIAWSTVTATELGRSGLLAGLTEKEMRFYFVHSYSATGVDESDLVATAEYLGHRITAAVQRGNVYGTQFHPEKSGPSGLRVLANFVGLCA